MTVAINVQSSFRIVRAKKAGQSLSPTDMFMSCVGDDFEAVHYALAWSFVHYLIHRDGGKHKREFYAFLKAMNGSGVKPVERVFAEATGSELSEVAKGWVPHVLALKAPELPERPVILPKNAGESEDVQPNDVLVKVNGNNIDRASDFEEYWTRRDRTKPTGSRVQATARSSTG